MQSKKEEVTDREIKEIREEIKRKDKAEEVACTVSHSEEQTLRK